jgi:hypothetical protein
MVARKRTGLSQDWTVRAIKAVGNCGEIFERNSGVNAPLRLERGLNALSLERPIEHGRRPVGASDPLRTGVWLARGGRMTLEEGRGNWCDIRTKHIRQPEA